MPMRKETKINISLILFSAAIFLVLSEFILRNTIVPVEKRESHFEKGVIIRDKIIGYRLRPNQRTIMSDGYFKEELITNKDGLRDIYNYSYKNLGLIAIGDSYTFGHGIGAKDTWVEQLQERLGVNVVNAGVFSYAIWQYKYVLRELYRKGYPIKLVLYAMPWNDFRCEASILEGPIFSEGRLVNDPAYSNKKIRKKTFLETIVKNKLFLYITERLALGKLFYSVGSEILSFFKINTTPGLDEQLEQNIAVTRKEILEIVKFLDQVGARLVIVNIGDITFVMPDKWQRHQRRHKYSRDCVRNSFADWAKAHGIYFKDAVPELESEYLKNGKKRASIALQVDNHYNKGAYKIIAYVFYRIITENKLLGS